VDKDKLLEGKRILIVDDEPDVLDSLEDLLPMCVVTKASTFDQAKALLEDQYFDMAILDIMGVEGYELLKICNEKRVIGVMLTALKSPMKMGLPPLFPKKKCIIFPSF
jgi:DNA-binding response OmpR family regulator